MGPSGRLAEMVSRVPSPPLLPGLGKEEGGREKKEAWKGGKGWARSLSFTILHPLSLPLFPFQWGERNHVLR